MSTASLAAKTEASAGTAQLSQTLADAVNRAAAQGGNAETRREATRTDSRGRRGNMAGRYVNAEGSLFARPPAAVGRSRVLRQLGTGATGRLVHGADPDIRQQAIGPAPGTDSHPARAHGLGLGLAERDRARPSPAAPIEAVLDDIAPGGVMRFAPNAPPGRALERRSARPGGLAGEGPATAPVRVVSEPRSQTAASPAQEQG